MSDGYDELFGGYSQLWYDHLTDEQREWFDGLVDRSMEVGKNPTWTKVAERFGELFCNGEPAPKPDTIRTNFNTVVKRRKAKGEILSE